MVVLSLGKYFGQRGDTNMEKDRIYNKKTKTEVIPGIHEITEDCVVLSEDSPFFSPTPTGKKLSVGSDGIPKLTKHSSNNATVEERSSNLKAQANAYQNMHMWPDEIAIINGYSEEEIQDKPKALKNREWSDKIFWIYENKLANPDDPTPFSNAGLKKYSYKEIQIEKRTI